MSKRIYTPEEIKEIAGNVASIIEETGSLVDAMDELTSNGAPEVSLTTMSAGLTLLSLIPNSTNNSSFYWVRCTQDDRVSSQSCSTHASYSDQVHVKYTFAKGRLSD